MHPRFSSAVPSRRACAPVGWAVDNLLHAIPVIHMVEHMVRFEVAWPDAGLLCAQPPAAATQVILFGSGSSSLGG